VYLEIVKYLDESRNKHLLHKHLLQNENVSGKSEFTDTEKNLKSRSQGDTAPNISLIIEVKC
jgi:hypothetical protein